MNKKQSEKTIKPTSGRSYSMDEFVTFLYDAFGLREGRQYNLHDINNTEMLRTKIIEMVDILAEHISPDDEVVHWKLAAMFEFMNHALLQFHKAEIYNDLDRGELYSLLVRDVLLPMIKDAMYLIAKKQAPLIDKPDELSQYRSDRMINHLLYMLESSYLKDATANVEKWFSHQKKFLKHGFATDFKKEIKNYGAKVSHTKLSTIIKHCTELEADKTPDNNEKYNGFPTCMELKSFWQSARVAQYLSKHIDFSVPEQIALLKYRDDLFALLKQAIETENYKLDDGLMTDAYELLSKNLRSRDLILAELDIFNYFEKLMVSVTKQPPPPLADNAKPIIKFLHGYVTVYYFIANNELLKAYELSLTTIGKYNDLTTGRLLDILINLAIALEIKLELKATKRFEYDALAKKVFLRGSSCFDYEKSESDPFKRVSNTILSSPAIIYAFSSIATYVDALNSCDELSEEERITAMIPFPSIVELALKSIYEIAGDLSNVSLSEIKTKLSKFMIKNCIPYIPGSTLYKCLTEINTLVSFWPQEMLDLVEYTLRFCQEPIHIKRKVLLAIDSSAYREDAKLNATSVLKTTHSFTVNEQTVEYESHEVHLDIEHDKDFYKSAFPELAENIQHRITTDVNLKKFLSTLNPADVFPESMFNTQTQTEKTDFDET